MKKRTQRGETLIGFMASVAITALVLAGVVNGLMGFSKGSEDDKLISEANDKARLVSDLMSFELRFAGSGVPFQQANFLMTATGLGTASLPILTTSTASLITFKANPEGIVGYLSASFNSASQTSFTLVSNPGISAGDTVYLSDMTEGGTDGMQAVVSSVAGTTITVNSFVQSAGATYAAGSTVEPAQTVIYQSNGGAITRAVGAQTPITIANGSFSLQYLDTTGAVMTLPLTPTTIATNLASLSLTITIPSSRTLSSGATYNSTLTTKIALRELNVFR